MMSGVNPIAVQRILRHTDPRITAEVYGHLAPEYMRAEIDHLRFGTGELAEKTQQQLAANSENFAASLLQESKNDSKPYQDKIDKQAINQCLELERAMGLEPTTLSLGS